MVKIEDVKQQQSREGQRKLKRGNLRLERNEATVSPSLRVRKSEEDRRNTVMVFSQNRDMGNCCHWQNGDMNLSRLHLRYCFKAQI